MGWEAQRGVFRDDLVGGVYGPCTRRGLPFDQALNQRVGSDRQEAAYWRRTAASGWVMPLALSAQADDGFIQRLYAGADAPAASAASAA